MMKNFINKILDVPKLIRRIWLLLWILLAILLIMKFCFGIWFPIIIKNQIIINFDNWVKGSWIKYIFSSIFYMFNANVVYLISCRKKKYSKLWEFIIINILAICSCTTKIIFGTIFGFIFESIMLIIIPMIYLFKKYNHVNKFKIILYIILIQVLIMAWQLNIFLVRGINFEQINKDYYIFGLILQLDYYIFIIITWIGVSFMGIWGVWFFSKDVTVLKAEREKELAKKNPNMDKVAKIDEYIKELEKEEK